MSQLFKLIMCLLCLQSFAACNINFNADPKNDFKHTKLSDQYSLIETDNIKIYSRLDKAQSEKWAKELELFRYSLFTFFDYPDINAGHDKVAFYLIDDKIVFNSLKSGMYAAGFYRNQIASPKIIIDISKHNIKPNAIFHEYFHHFHANEFEQKLPIWMNEGLAEYFSNFKSAPDTQQFVFGTGDLSKPLYANTFELYDETISSLNNYPYYEGKVYKKNYKIDAYHFYRLSWAICDWLMDTTEGRELYQEILVSLDNGIAPSVNMTADVKIKIQEHIKLKNNVTVVDASGFFNRPELDVKISNISNDDMKQHWLYILEAANSDIDKTTRDYLTTLSNPNHIDPVYAHLIMAAKAYRKDDITAFNKTMGQISKITPLNSEATALNAKIRFKHPSASEFEKKSQAAFKDLEDTHQDNIMMKTLYLTARDKRYYNEDEIKIFNEIKQAHALKRLPFSAVRTFRAHLIMKKFDDAEKILNRARLWNAGRIENYDEKINLLESDLEMARKFYEEE